MALPFILPQKRGIVVKDPMERDYENAIKIINSRQRAARPVTDPSDSAVLREQEGSGQSSKTPDLRGNPSISGMKEWLEAIGHDEQAINNVNVIHIAGTKGKGSTCAFIESFLRNHGQTTGFPRKTGMYTGPHLMDPEERIRINSLPITRELFARYFFEVYDKLPQLAQAYYLPQTYLDRCPRYLQLYALLGFHVFIREKVDIAILETHSGGQYCATNVVTKPVVTAITSLGMDHVQTLGPTIENIAWHKAGIFKRGAYALSTIQDPGPAEVLEDRAKAVGMVVRFVEEDAQLPRDASQLQPAVQRKNASLAIAVANAFLDAKSKSDSRCLTADNILDGIAQWHWPGRFEVMSLGTCTVFFDSAHNDMSLPIAADWFADRSKVFQPTARKMVIFAHENETRDSVALLSMLADSLKKSDVHIDHAIFTTYRVADDTHENSNNNNHSLVAQKPGDHRELGKTWKQFFDNPNDPLDERTIADALARAWLLAHRRDLEDEPWHILVTGSQHLVGPALKLIKERWMEDRFAPETDPPNG